MPLVRPFVAPISAGGLPHTGAIPQSHVSYHVITPQGSGLHGSGTTSITTQTGSSLKPIIVGQGHLPVSVTPLQYPTSVTPALPINRGQNWFNNPHS